MAPAMGSRRIGRRRRRISAGPTSARAWVRAAAVACVVLVVGPPVRANDAPPDAAPGTAPDPVTEAQPEDVGELWRDAQAKLGTSDYAGAIERLTRLYERVVQDPEADALRQRVRWALVEAHVGAYRIDRDAQHLAVATDLLGKYTESLALDDAGSRTEAEARRGEIDALTQAHVEPEPEPEPEPESEPEPEPEPEPEAAPVEAASAEPSRPSRPLVITGAVLTGIGVIGLGLLVGGLASANAAIGTFETEPDRRADARDDITRGNALGITGGVLAGVFTVSGAALLGIGLQRRRMAVSPSASATDWGIAWIGRF